MNKIWIKDSHNSAELFKDRLIDHNQMRLIRILDIAGMFETSWMVFDHSRNEKYGYPK